MEHPSIGSRLASRSQAFGLLVARQGWEHLGRASLLEGREYAQVGRAEAREAGDTDAEARYGVQLGVIDAELGRRERATWATSGPKAPKRFDAAFAHRLKELVPLPLLVHRTHPLKKSGDHAVGLCPFHVEQTPSFHVFLDHFKCFGCGVHGDHYDWITQAWRGERPEGSGVVVGLLDFPDAVRMLASFWNVPVPALSGERLRPDQP